MDNNEKWVIPVIVAAAILAMCCVSYIVGKDNGYKKGYETGIGVQVKKDTVWRDSLVFVETPVEVVKWKDREKLVYIDVHDTTVVHDHDTTFIALPREFKQYGDETYEAQVSGIDPSLDWIKVHQKTAYITNTVIEKKRWGFGISAGPGIIWDGKFHGGVGVVAGLQYNF